MQKINKSILKNIYHPSKDSHKGQNGKLTIIGGSKLFHGASLWALKTASRIVDMVFYCTVKENRELVRELKSKLYDFIFISRSKVDDYIKQSDAVLIGPGLVRGSKKDSGTGESGQMTKKLTKGLLFKFPKKKWVIDAGSLQVMEVKWLKKLDKVVITPHRREFEELFRRPKAENRRQMLSGKARSRFAGKTDDRKPKLNYQSLTIDHQSLFIKKLAKQFGCTIVLKGPTDIICSPSMCVYNTTGNEGMTKGGTGDVLAGLIGALACKNELFLSASAGVYINGLAGDNLYKRVGPYYNASDLCEEIPKILKKFLE
jgi:NAD(P)H-hydrate epimerase